MTSLTANVITKKKQPVYCRTRSWSIMIYIYINTLPTGLLVSAKVWHGGGSLRANLLPKCPAATIISKSNRIATQLTSFTYTSIRRSQPFYIFEQH